MRGISGNCVRTSSAQRVHMYTVLSGEDADSSRSIAAVLRGQGSVAGRTDGDDLALRRAIAVASPEAGLMRFACAPAPRCSPSGEALVLKAYKGDCCIKR